jgi:hypothetical protein
VSRDLFAQLGQRPRGGEPERLGDILSRVVAAIMCHVENTEREAGGTHMTDAELRGCHGPVGRWVPSPDPGERHR